MTTRTDMLNLWHRIKKNGKCIVYRGSSVIEYETERGIAIGFHSRLGDDIPIAVYYKPKQILTWLEPPLVYLPGHHIRPRYRVYMTNLPEKKAYSIGIQTLTLNREQMAEWLAADYAIDYRMFANTKAHTE